LWYLSSKEHGAAGRNPKGEEGKKGRKRTIEEKKKKKWGEFPKHGKDIMGSNV